MLLSIGPVVGLWAWVEAPGWWLRAAVLVSRVRLRVQEPLPGLMAGRVRRVDRGFRADRVWARFRIGRGSFRAGRDAQAWAAAAAYPIR